MKKYMIILDVRTGKTYLDFSDTIIRGMFEKIMEKSNSKDELRKKYPDAIDLTSHH